MVGLFIVFHIPDNTWFYIAFIIYIVITYLVRGANGSGAVDVGADDVAQKTNTKVETV
jgi:hypothetical protein